MTIPSFQDKFFQDVLSRLGNASEEFAQKNPPTISDTCEILSRTVTPFFSSASRQSLNPKLTALLRTEAGNAKDVRPLHLAYLYKFLVVTEQISAVIGALNSNIPSVDGQTLHGSGLKCEIATVQLMLRSEPWSLIIAQLDAAGSPNAIPNPNDEETFYTSAEEQFLTVFQTVLVCLHKITQTTAGYAEKATSAAFGKNPAGFHNLDDEISGDASHRGLFSATSHAMYLQQYLFHTVQQLSAATNAWKPPLTGTETTDKTELDSLRVLDLHLTNIVRKELIPNAAVFLDTISTQVQTIILDITICMHCMTTFAAVNSSPRLSGKIVRTDMLDLFGDVKELRRQRDAATALRIPAAEQEEKEHNTTAANTTQPYALITQERISGPDGEQEMPFGFCFVWISKATEIYARALDDLPDVQKMRPCVIMNPFERSYKYHSPRIFDALHVLVARQDDYQGLATIPVSPVESALLCARWCQMDEAVMANLCTADVARKLIGMCVAFLDMDYI